MRAIMHAHQMHRAPAAAPRACSTRMQTVGRACNARWQLRMQVQAKAQGSGATMDTYRTTQQGMVGQLQEEAGIILGVCSRLETQYQEVQQLQEHLLREHLQLQQTEHLYMRREDTAREQAALLVHTGPGSCSHSLQAAASSSPPAASLALVADALRAEQQRLGVKVWALRRRRCEMSYHLSTVEALPAGVPEQELTTTSSSSSSSSSSSHTCSSSQHNGVEGPGDDIYQRVFQQMALARKCTRRMYASILRHSSREAARHQTRVTVLQQLPSLQRAAAAQHTGDPSQQVDDPRLCQEVQQLLQQLDPLQQELQQEVALFKQAQQQELAAAAACRQSLMHALHVSEQQLEDLLREMQSLVTSGPYHDN